MSRKKGNANGEPNGSTTPVVRRPRDPEKAPYYLLVSGEAGGPAPVIMAQYPTLGRIRKLLRTEPEMMQRAFGTFHILRVSRVPAIKYRPELAPSPIENVA